MTNFDRIFVAIMLIVALQSALASDDTATLPQPTAKKAPFYLIVDYLPVAVYDGDPLTACFRIENTTGQDAKLKLITSVQDENDKIISQKTEGIIASAKEFTVWQGVFDTTQGRSIAYLLMRDESIVERVRVSLIRDDSAWPTTKISDGRLIASATEPQIVIPVVRKRLKVENRAFAPLKWLLGYSSSVDDEKFKSVFFAPGRWQMRNDKFDLNIEALGPYARDGATPILRALDQILNAFAKRGDTKNSSNEIIAMRRVTIILPPEDLELSTDPRVYRLVVDALLAHLARYGVKQIILIPPMHFGASDKHRQSLWQSVRDAAATYEARFIIPTAYLDEKLWRLDPEIEGIYGLAPNVEGLNVIEREISEMIK